MAKSMVVSGAPRREAVRLAVSDAIITGARAATDADDDLEAVKGTG